MFLGFLKKCLEIVTKIALCELLLAYAIVQEKCLQGELNCSPKQEVDGERNGGSSIEK